MNHLLCRYMRVRLVCICYSVGIESAVLCEGKRSRAADWCYTSVVVICPGRSQAVDSIRAVRLERPGRSWGEVPIAVVDLVVDHS